MRSESHLLLFKILLFAHTKKTIILLLCETPMKIDAESRLKKANYAEEDQLRMRGVRAKLR